MKLLQMYYECKLFGTNDCPYKETPVLKKRECILDDFERWNCYDFGTEEEHNERKRICNNCDKFVHIKNSKKEGKRAIDK